MPNRSDYSDDSLNLSWGGRSERDLNEFHAPRRPALTGVRPQCTDHDSDAAWSAMRVDGFMAAYDGMLVLELRTCMRCKSTVSRERVANTEEALECLRREGLL